MKNFSGLTSHQVRSQRAKFGRNILDVSSGQSLLKKITSQFTDLMVIILIVSAFIALLSGYYQGEESSIVDGYVILGVVFLNAGIGFFQEYRTEKALQALKKLVAPHAIVLRDGKKELIDSADLVPDDIVVLQAGDKIVADGILLESDELKVEESALTGESVPVHKKEKSEVFMGTTAVSGGALLHVQATGMKTAFGRIAHLTTSTKKDLSPLQKEMIHVGVFVTKVTLVISTLLIVFGVFVEGRGFLDSLLFAVSVAVAAVPEGLPTTLTVALALGVQKMVKKKAMVKQLSSIETLGSTTVICSDKTGTLTQNQMTVRQLLIGLDDECDVTGTGYSPEKGHIDTSQLQVADYQNLSLMKSISIHCTEASLNKSGNRYEILGDPTEGALLTLAGKKVIKEKKRDKLLKGEILKKIPFDSERKLMSIAVDNNGKNELWVKGSPDEIVQRSTHVLSQGKRKKLTTAQKMALIKKYEKMASRALRGIAFATRSLPKKQSMTVSSLQEQESNLTFIGIAGMIDPPRQAVPKAVQQCHKAGVRTLIITGDNGLTAKAIADEIGLGTYKTRIVLGTELDKMNDRKLDLLLKWKRPVPFTQDDLKSASLIFSRVSPEHKRRIVDRLKKKGEVVAVTGDGVNDAPALKRADLGIAMGISGTEVSKETANIILLNDSFASIVDAISEGRRIYANMRKFIWYLFSCNVGELLVVFSSVLLQIPTPLTATLILAINLGTDIFPAISLGVDHAQVDIMQKKPRNPHSRILEKDFISHFLSVGLLIGFLVISLYLWKLQSMGWEYGMVLGKDSEILRSGWTMSFASLVIFQLFNNSNARALGQSLFSLRILWLQWLAIGSSLVIVISIVYIPWLQGILKTTGLATTDWVLILFGGALILGFEEGRKFILRRNR
ncbi:MAG: cation-transporting P-type ATPase [Candidatus Gracilibacteria bacterium]|nr:cation-transporting P-type ATPase [Candidatus Gracilibacteria bacterium]